MFAFSTISLVLLSVLVSDVTCYIISNVDFNNIFSGLKLDSSINFSDEEMQLMKISLIYPGTKWCGAGDTAENYDDLGPERETDMCCREHDFCPEFIGAGETKHNLTNEAYYYRLSCKCDERFRKCLRAVDSNAARNIGFVYFNTLLTKCFRKDYPVIKCQRRGGWLNKKCLEYSYNTTAEMKYQWFDVENF